MSTVIYLYIQLSIFILLFLIYLFFLILLLLSVFFCSVTVIVGDSIIRHVRATLAEGKVHAHCFPGARVLDVSAQIPAILKGDESVAAVVIHAGVNNTKMRQTETLKRDFRSPATTIIVSGPEENWRNKRPLSLLHSLWRSNLSKL